ncbi:MAG: hypothetical protein AVDCRST_MAG45-149 [uncultured Solirubrobacterales bacterium]|uniref:Uncharacterized protein n=1 Tax=uncultured Solirubrobacterales bacterium TaxID=768556 RepID=A0A6J4RST3_9ACTN|nr:MAG: hypothetical protein AVDCRST_MAG45-149 [uncultured Solirubrobacterales bacterium]
MAGVLQRRRRDSTPRWTDHARTPARREIGDDGPAHHRTRGGPPG